MTPDEQKSVLRKIADMPPAVVAAYNSNPRVIAREVAASQRLAGIEITADDILKLPPVDLANPPVMPTREQWEWVIKELRRKTELLDMLTYDE